MTKTQIKDQVVKELAKAKNHLEYSYKKVTQISLDKELGEEQLEVLESFASRFARFSDIAVAKYFRTLILAKDPAFRGSVIDLLNHAEKYQWIASRDIWMRIRELRNLAAHEYSPEDFKQLYQELVQLTPNLLVLSLDL